MGKKEELFAKLTNAIMSFDDEGIDKISEEIVLKEKLSIVETVNVIAKAMKDLGDMFQRMEVALPELVVSADGVKKAMKHISKALETSKEKVQKFGVVVHGTVQGDIHSVGKDMVEMFLATSGFEVYDLGTDVAPRVFIEKAEELKADLICASALMSTSMPVQRDLIDFLKAKGVRDKYKVMVGGGPVNVQWAEKIGADGWGKDAVEARTMALKLLEKA